MIVPVLYSNLMLLSTAYHQVMSATNAKNFHQNLNLWPHRDIFTKLPAVFSAAQQVYSHREGPFPWISSAADFSTARKAYSLREGVFPRISSQAVFSTAPKPHHLGPNTSSQRTTSKHTLKHASKHTSEHTSEHSCYQVHIHQPRGFKLKSNKLNQKKWQKRWVMEAELSSCVGAQGRRNQLVEWFFLSDLQNFG